MKDVYTNTRLSQIALDICKQSVPELVDDFYINELLIRIDEISSNIYETVSGISNPELIIKEINEYLFGKERFDVGGDFFLSTVLKTKKGDCAGLSILYLSVTEYLSLPIYGVYLPGHMLVRWSTKEYSRNIDTTILGCDFSDEYYIKKYKIPKICIVRGVYMNNLTKNEVIAILYNNRGSAYTRKGIYRKAIADYITAIKMKPNLVSAYHNLGDLYFRLHKYDLAVKEYRRALDINPEYTPSKCGINAISKIVESY